MRTSRKTAALIACCLVLFSPPTRAQTTNTWRPIGPTFSTVLAFERHPQHPSTLLAGTYFGGIYRSTDYGYTWTHVATEFSTRSIFALAYDSLQPSTVYAGTFQTGVFKSVDSGSTWMAINTGLPDRDIQAIAVDPFDSQTMLAATSNSGVFRSINAGGAWARVDIATPPLRGKTIAFDRTRAGVVYVGTIGQGVYRSGDGGVTFQPFSNGLPTTTSVLSLRFSDAADHGLYMAADQGVFRLADAGTTWTNVTYDLPPLPASDVLPHPTIPNMAIAATLTGLFVMADHTAAAPHWVGWHAQPTRTLTVDPTGSVFHAASVHAGLIATTNFGATWFQANAGIQNLFAGALAMTHAPGAESRLFVGSDFAVHRAVNGVWDVMSDVKQAVFDVQVDPSDANTLYIGTERGGVWKSTNAGVTWSPSADNIVPAQIFDVAEAADGNLVFAATTSGLYVSPDKGAQWTLSNTGDLSFILSLTADPTRAPILWIGGPSGQVYRTTDGGFSWIRASTGLPAESIVHLAAAPWEKAYAITASGALYATSDEGRNWFSASNGVAHPAVALAADPNRPWVLYLATYGGGIYKSESASLEWSPSRTGLGAAFVFSLAVDPSNTSRVFAGTDNGLYRSVDEGAQWTRVGTGLPTGGITGVTIDPAISQHLWASVENAGVFRSQDGGATWTPAHNGLPTIGAVPILLSRGTAATLFAGTPVNGVFKSIDGGASWQRSSFGLTLFVRGVAVDPVDPQTIYAGSLGAGVFKSTNGASTWTAVGLRDRNIFELAIDPTAHQTLYAATSRGVSRTTNGGQSWANLGQKTAYIHSMVVDPRDRLRLYIGTTGGTIYRSADGGQSWTSASTGLPPHTVLALTLDAGSGTLFASPDRQGVYYSTNDGASWSPMPSGAFGTETVASLAIDPQGTLFAGTLGAGVFAFRSGTWQLASTGLASRYVAHVAVASDGGLYASTFDTGVFRSQNGGATWEWAAYGLTTNRVLGITPSPSNAALLYAATPDGVFRSGDRGATWQAIHTGMQNITVQQLVIDRFDESVLYAATNARGVYRSSNGGVTWQAISTGLLNHDVSTLAQGVPAGDLYAGTLGGGLSRTTTSGAEWLGGTTPQMIDQFVLAIAVDPIASGTVYAATAGQGVQKSTNGGVDWASMNNGLAGLFLLSITVDKHNPNTLYAGTSGHGVYYTTNGGASWKPLNTGLFNHTVTALVVDPADSTRLFAGTEGGGVFAAQVSLAPTTCTYALSASTLSVAAGASTAAVDVTTDAGCGWRVDSGAEWTTASDDPERTGSGSVTLSLAINTGGSARSGLVSIAGLPVVVNQAGQLRTFRLTINRSGNGTGVVTSDWLGISCGDDCAHLFNDSLPVTLSAIAAQGSQFISWSGDADCVDGVVVMSADRVCTARFERTNDFDQDTLPDLWEAQFGLDPASAVGAHGSEGDPDGDGRTNAQELADGTHPRGFVTRYFAAGETSSTTDTHLALFNPGTSAAHVLVRLFRNDGAPGSTYAAVESMARAVLDLRTVPDFATAQFSAIVESDGLVAAERTIEYGSPFSSTSDLAADAPAGAWYLGPSPTGSVLQGGGFQLRYVLFNPSASASDIDLIHLPQPAGAPVVNELMLAAGARTVIDVGALDAALANTLVTGVIQATVPIVVESQVHLGDRSVASGPAVPQPVYLGYLGEGRTGTLDTILSLFNPTATSTSAIVTYVGEGGQIAQQTHVVGPFGGIEIPVRQEQPWLADSAFSAVVSSPTAPLVIGRTTFWPGAQPVDWYESYASTAVATPAVRLAVPSGALGGAQNSQTDLILTNFTGSAASVRVMLVFDDGTTSIRTFSVGAAHRHTVSIGTDFPEAAFRPFSALVESLALGVSPAVPIVVERSTYGSPGGVPWATGSHTTAVPVPLPQP